MHKPVIIDLSEFNRVTDFSKVAQNVDMIIIRLGYRYSVDATIKYDKKYSEYLDAIKKYNIPYSFYFVSQAITPEEAQQEAAFVAEECKKHITQYHLPVFVDTERINRHSRADIMTKEQRTKCIKAFCDALQRAGVPAGVYSNLSWLNNNLDMNQLPYSVWVAEYGPRNTYTGKYLLWQYTSTGSISGIEGNVDISCLAEAESGPVVEHSPAPVSTSEINGILAVEESEVGYLEKRTNASLDDKTMNAGSNNYTKYWRDLYPAFQRQPWCAAFQCWSFGKALGAARAKQLLLGDYAYYCPTLVNRYKKAGRWFSTPNVGDLIFFKDSSGVASHIGFVRAVDAVKVYTIEGNTGSGAGVIANGGGVFKKEYPLNYYRILGYARPTYNVAEVKPMSAKLFDRSLSGTYRVTASKLNMRTDAGMNNSIITVLDEGNQVSNYGYYSNDADGTPWLYVSVGKYIGFVSSLYLSKI